MNINLGNNSAAHINTQAQTQRNTSTQQQPLPNASASCNTQVAQHNGGAPVQQRSVMGHMQAALASTRAFANNTNDRVFASSTRSTAALLSACFGVGMGTAGGVAGALAVPCAVGGFIAAGNLCHAETANTAPQDSAQQPLLQTQMPAPIVQMEAITQKASRILFYSPEDKAEPWLESFARAMPEADVNVWQEGATGSKLQADYVVAWQPPQSMLEGQRDLKAIFNLGAGVEGLLKLGDALPADVPLVRLDDAGMGTQMAQYVTHAVLRYFRCFDQYENQARNGQWDRLQTNNMPDFTVGILGLGALGSRIALALAPFEFPLRGWSQSTKNVSGVECFAGSEQLDAFLRGTRVLVCVLPLTNETRNLLDHANLSKLKPSAYLINVARGAIVSETDLMMLVDSGHIAGATLDVFHQEPLPDQHQFWQEERITITPHIAALPNLDDSVQQIADNIRALERGETIGGVVDRSKGY